MPFDDNSFDYVIMLDILEHLYFPKKLLIEARRISKKYIIIGVPNFNSLAARVQMFLGKIPENNTPQKGHVYWFNYRILMDMLKEYDLELINFKSNAFWQKTFLRTFFLFLAKYIPSLFSSSFVVKVKKI